MPIGISTALQAAYDDGESVIIRTLSFVSSNGVTINQRLVQGFEDMSLKDDAGATHTHKAVNFSVSLPERSASLAKALQFSVEIGNDSETNLLPALTSLSGDTITATYREYLLGDTTPAFPGISFTVTSVSYTFPTLSVVASNETIQNAAFPNYYYNVRDFQGLKYYGR